MYIEEALNLQVGEFVYTDCDRKTPLEVKVVHRNQQISKNFDGRYFIWIGLDGSEWPSIRLSK